MGSIATRLGFGPSGPKARFLTTANTPGAEGRLTADERAAFTGGGAPDGAEEQPTNAVTTIANTNDLIDLETP